MRFDIDYKSKIGMFNIICSKQLKMRNSIIGHFNIMTVKKVEMDNARIINLNRINGFKSLNMSDRSLINKRNLIYGCDNKSNLEMGVNSNLLISMIVNVDKDIVIGSNVCFAGSGSQIWTHSYDIERNLTEKGIIIGSNITVGSRSIINAGISICDNVTIGSGTTVSKNITEPGVYVSSSLIKKG